MRGLRLAAIVFIIIVSAFAGGLVGTAAADPVDIDPDTDLAGEGVDGDPYIITNVSELQAMEQDLSAHYEVGNDINASETADWNGGAGFDPIGSEPLPFIGSFDGDGYTISNLAIDRSDEDYIGLFSASDEATITNVTLEDADITGDEQVGGLVGWNEGLIADVAVSGSVTGNELVGGMVGHHRDEIRDSYSIADVTGDVDVGGLVGWSQGGEINRTYAIGDVTGDSGTTGGLVGTMSSLSSVLEESYATGTVTVTGDGDVGGLVGDLASGTVERSFWDEFTTDQSDSDGGTGLMTFQMKGAAAVDNMDDFDFENTWDVVADKQVSYPFLQQNTQDPAPGLQTPPFAGGGGTEDAPYQIEDWHHLNNVRDELDANFTLNNDLDTDSSGYETYVNTSDGFEPIGDGENAFTGTFDGDENAIANLTIERSNQNNVGLFGVIDDDATIKKLSVESADVTGDRFAGVLVGTLEDGQVSDVSVAGEIDGHGRLGGLIGDNEGTVSNATAAVTVTGSSRTVGGLVGTNDRGTIEYSSATGSVTSDGDWIGGLVGTNDRGTVSDSYATGDVSGEDAVGGVVGWNERGQIETVYATGDVTGDDEIGGLVGWNDGATVTEGYAAGNVSAIGDDVGGVVGDNAGTMEEVYFDTTTTGQADGYGTSSGTIQYWGLTTVEMTGDDAEDNMFDFGDTWVVVDDPADGNEVSYPFLQNNTQDPAPGMQTRYASGDGDAEPYELTDWGELDSVRANLNAEFTLTDDLDESTAGYDSVASETANGGDGFDPIGTGAFRDDFTGTFNGNGFIISNLTIDRSGENQVGLFGETGDANVKNVGLEDVDIHGEGNVGGIIGSNSGTVSESYATGSVVGGSSRIGGLVGSNSGTVSESYATGSVTGDGNTVGGLVGNNNNNGKISESYAESAVTGDGDRVGGLVGESRQQSTVTKSYATGTVDGRVRVGGLVGSNSDSTVNESYATGDVNGLSSVGGFVGTNSAGAENITHVYWDDQAATITEDGIEVFNQSSGGEALRTVKMTGANAMQNMDGFAFPTSSEDGTWHATASYPVLEWEDTDPFFGVTITDTNSPITGGDTLEVTTNVTNWGADGGDQTIELRDTDFDDKLQDYTAVSLDSGHSEAFTLQWNTAVETTGDGAVTVTSTDDHATRYVTVEPVPADTIDADVTVDEAIADGEDEVEFTVTLTNEFDNPAEGATVVVDDAEDVAALGGIDSGDETQTDRNGEATFTATSIDTGEFTVQFSEENAGSETATATFEAGDADTVTVDTVDETAVADGEDTLAYTVTVEDANDNPAPGVQVLTTDNGTDIDYAGDDDQATDENGELTVTATSTTAQANISFTFQEQDQDTDVDASGTFEAGLPAEIDATVTADDAVADGADEVEVTVTVKDDNANPVEDAVVAVDAAEDIAAVGGIDAGDEEATNDNGHAIFTATSTDAGAFTVQFSEPNAGSDTATVTFEVGAPDSVTISDSNPADETVIADGTDAVTYTVVVEDANDNPVEDVTVEADGTAGNNVELNEDGSTTDETTTATGEVTFEATSIEAQADVTITFTETDTDSQASGQATFEAGTPDSVSVETITGSATADGTDALEYTITIEDTNANPVPELSVTTTDDGTNIEYAGDDDQQTDENGQLTVTATSTTVQEDVTFTIEEQDEQTDATADGTFEAGEAADIDATVTADNAIADGTDEVEFTIAIEDESGNAVEDASVEIDDAEDIGELDGLEAGDTAETDTDGNTMVTATATNDGAFTVQFSEEDAGIATATATFVVGEPATVSADAIEDTAIADGTDELGFEVTVTDATNNAIEGVEVVATHDGSAIDIEPSTPETDDDGEQTFTATSTAAQDGIEFTFTEQGEENAETIEGTFEPGDPADVLIDAEPANETVTADGQTAVTYTATVLDLEENPIEGVTIEADATAGTDVDINHDGEVTAETTDSSGAVTFEATSTTTQAGVTVEFTEQDQSIATETTALTFETGDADSVTVTTQPATTTAGEAIEGPPAVTVTDPYNNPVEDVAVDVGVSQGPGTITAGETTVETEGDGTATFDDIVIEVADDDHVFEFSIDDADENVDLADTDQSNTFTVTPDDATTLDITSQPLEGAAGDAIDGPPTVDVSDQFGNEVENESVTVDANESDILSGETIVQTDADGVAAFDGPSIEAAGNYTLTFELEDDSTVTVTSNAFEITPAGVDSVEIEPEAEQTIDAGETVEFEAIAFDEFENVVEDDDTTFNWTNADNGTFEETTVGEYEVTAELNGIASDPTTVTVEAAPSTGSGTSSPSTSVDSDQTTSVRTVGDELRADITPTVSDGVSESHLEFSNTRTIELRFVADDTADEDRPVATTDRLAVEFTESIDTAVTVREGSEPTSDDARNLDESLEAVGYLQIATDFEPDQFESATIEFSLPIEALESVDGDTDAVSLHHFDPDADEWRSLETTVTDETEDELRYSVGVDSFSQFAIGVGLPDVDDNSSADETDVDDASGGDDDLSTDETDSDSVTEDVDDETPGFSVGVTLLVIIVFLVASRQFRNGNTHS